MISTFHRPMRAGVAWMTINLLTRCGTTTCVMRALGETMLPISPIRNGPDAAKTQASLPGITRFHSNIASSSAEACSLDKWGRWCAKVSRACSPQSTLSSSVQTTGYAAPDSLLGMGAPRRGRCVTTTKTRVSSCKSAILDITLLCQARSRRIVTGPEVVNLCDASASLAHPAHAVSTSSKKGRLRYDMGGRIKFSAPVCNARSLVFIDKAAWIAIASCFVLCACAPAGIPKCTMDKSSLLPHFKDATSGR